MCANQENDDAVLRTKSIMFCWFCLATLLLSTRLHGVSLTAGPTVNDGDPYSYFQSFAFGSESFDVEFGASLVSGPSQLYVSKFTGLGIQRSATNPGITDYRQINDVEILELTFSGLEENQTVEITHLNGSNGSNYFAAGREIYLYKNDNTTPIHTVYGNGSDNYVILPPISARNGDTIKLNPNEDIRLESLTADVMVSLGEQTITQAGHYYLTSDWSELAFKPNSISVEVKDQGTSVLRWVREFGPDLAELDADLGILNPGDTVTIFAGLSGAAGEDSALWTTSLERYDSWSGSRYTPATVPVADASPLSGLLVHQNRWPRSSGFRSDFEGQGDYTRFLNALRDTLGHAPKTYAEERSASPPNLGHMQNYAEDFPQFQALVHWNGRTIELTQPEMPSNNDQFRPYHFIYQVGSYLSSGINSTDTSITVIDGSPFEAGYYAIIVPVDPATGERRFDDCELVEITAVNGTTLTVQRNLFGTFFGTTAGNHGAGAYIAPSDLRVESPLDATHFRMNYSTDCPRDSLGRNGADVAVEMLASSFAGEDELSRFHGIMFDVLSTGTRSNQADTSLDGIANNGLDPRGLDLVHLGVQGFARKIRAALPDRIITFDGNGAGWPRLHSVFNGMESEGFARFNDAYNTRWASALNWWQYTSQWNPSEYVYNFCVPKVNDLPDEMDKRPFKLMNNAAGTILGITMSHQSVFDPDATWRVDDQHGPDEMRLGVDLDLQWMGAPTGPIMRPALDTPDELAGTGLPASGWSSPDTSATISSNSDGLLVQATDFSYSSQAFMSIRSEAFSIPAGSVLIRFEARGDGFTHFPPDVARFFEATLDGRVDSQWTYGVLEGLFNSEGWTENVLYWRNAGGSGGRTVNLNLQFEGSGDVQIRNLTVHSAEDILAREFENGVVLCNPNPDQYTFNLAEMFPGVQLSRITGQSYDDPLTNDGSVIGDTVTVPSHRGLFLVKNQLRIENASSAEEDGTLNFNVMLSHRSQENVTIDFSTADVEAVAGLDYDAAIGNVTIPAGSESTAVQITLRDDRYVEEDESFLVNFQNPMGASLETPLASGTITDMTDRNAYNSWAAFYGLPSASGAPDDSQNTDSGTTSDLTEYYLGTDPTNRSDDFHIKPLGFGAGSLFEVEYSSVTPAATYILQKSSNLESWSDVEIYNPSASSSNVIRSFDSEGADNLFIRVDLRINP